MIKVLTTAIIGIAGYVLLLVFDRNQVGKADKIITIIEGACFVFTFFIHVYGLINIISAERDNRSNKRFITDAKKFVIMGIFLHICFVFLTVFWFSATKQSLVIDLHLDILYGLVDMFLCCYSWIGLQYVMNTTIRKSIIPGVKDPNDPLIGECLLVLGVSKETIERALEMQKGGSKDTSSISIKKVIEI